MTAQWNHSKPQDPKRFIGREYTLYNKEILARFNANAVTIRIDAHWGNGTFAGSVIHPREYDGEFIMCSETALRNYENGKS